MRELHQRARNIATELNISSGGLLKLAREAAHDGSLPSLDMLTGEQLREVIAQLELLQARTPFVIELV